MLPSDGCIHGLKLSQVKPFYGQELMWGCRFSQCFPKTGSLPTVTVFLCIKVSPNSFFLEQESDLGAYLSPVLPVGV